MQLSTFALLPAIHLWSKALRVHQWAKNLLLFVPLLTSFGFFDPARLRAALLAFAAFSLAASSTYLVNDLRDLEHDRLHPRKRYRPFASGRLSPASGLGAAAALAVAALALGAQVSAGLLGLLCLYLAITAAYN